MNTSMFRKKRAFFTLFLVAAFLLPVYAQNDSSSVLEDWRNTLKFGIDSQVLEVIPLLREQQETRLNGELVSVYQQTLSPKVKQAVLGFFTDMKSSEGAPLALSVLKAYQDNSDDIVTAAIRYASFGTEKASEEMVQAVAQIAEDRADPVGQSAVRALGKIGGDAEASVLLEKLQDSRTSPAMKESIVTALGDLGSATASNILIKMLRDTAADRALRWQAADALGKIGDREAVGPLTAVLSEDDSVLRAYAISALSKFDDSSVPALLDSALRDSFWRVRVAAIQGVAERGVKDSVPAIIYKAKYDPELKVRTEALSALAKMRTGEAKKFLSDYVSDEKNPPSARNSALHAMVENNLSDWMGTLRDVIQQEWDKPDSPVLAYLAKTLSTEKGNFLASTFSHFLQHPSYLIQIYGLRGIGLNEMSQFRDAVEKMTKDPFHPSVQKNAAATLEKL